MEANTELKEPDSFRKTALNHAMSAWFLPEIERRQAAGLAPKPFPFMAGQVIMYADERPVEIRLNEQVKAVLDVKYKDGVSIKIGEPVYANDVKGFKSVELPETEDPNCGHFTAMQLRGLWYFGFDFIYNKGRARDFLTIGQEFLEMASEAAAKHRFRAFVDNLFSAAEIAANVVLVVVPRPKDKPYPRHGAIHSRFNQFAKLGNVDPDERASFNKLAELRRKARYGAGKLQMNSAQAEKLLIGVKKLFERAKKLVARNIS
jgi:hypothetical protein